MAINRKDDIRSFERTRAANIVLKYENELREKLSAYPNAKNVMQVMALVERLGKMRQDIMGSMKPYVAPIKRDPGGDFSLEEIEAAMDMIEENPFGGE
jgi:hypothetical protein